MLTVIGKDKPYLLINGAIYHYHPNGGGLVALSAEVVDTAFIGRFVRICDCVKISGNPVLIGDVVVRNCVTITDSPYLCGDIKVSDNAVISGNAKIIGRDIEISGNAVVSGSTRIYDGVQIGDGAVLNGDTEWHGKVVRPGPGARPFVKLH